MQVKRAVQGVTPYGPAFTLIELLVVITIISLLVGIILPSLGRARVRSKVVKARAELYQICLALEAYHQEHDDYPMAATSCMMGGAWADHYHHLPIPLRSYSTGLSEKTFLPGESNIDPNKTAKVMEDVFSPGHSYKYTRPGWGWAMNPNSPQQNKTSVTVYVPERFPYDRRGSDPAEDTAYYASNAEQCPVEYAVWSVGPAGAKSFYEAQTLRHPIPKRVWYRMADGVKSEGVITIIKTKKHGFIQSEP